jgi:hypothetical protein
MGAGMQRRAFVGLIGDAMVWPLAARAQQDERMRPLVYCCLPSHPNALILCSAARSGSWSPLAFGWMNGFAPGEHFHKLANSLIPRFGPPGIVDAIDEGIPIRTVERRKRPFRFRICSQRSQEIGRRFGFALGLIRRTPATIGLGSLDLAQSGRLHARFANKALRRIPINCGPSARASPRRHSHQIVVLIELPELTIDPSVT